MSAKKNWVALITKSGSSRAVRSFSATSESELLDLLVAWSDVEWDSLPNNGPRASCKGDRWAYVMDFLTLSPYRLSVTDLAAEPKIPVIIRLEVDVGADGSSTKSLADVLEDVATALRNHTDESITDAQLMDGSVRFDTREGPAFLSLTRDDDEDDD